MCDLVLGLHILDSASTKLWYIQLGHMCEKGIIELSKQYLLCDKKIDKLDFYEHCVYGK